MSFKSVGLFSDGITGRKYKRWMKTGYVYIILYLTHTNAKKDCISSVFSLTQNKNNLNSYNDKYNIIVVGVDVAYNILVSYKYHYIVGRWYTFVKVPELQAHTLIYSLIYISYTYTIYLIL